jgi:lipopolysaccharide assembly protein A
MLLIIFLLAGGASLAYLSKYNMMSVSVNLGFQTFNDIPLFYVIVASLLLGMIVSYVYFSFHNIAAFFKLRGKKNEIKQGKESVLELTKRIHQLELENEKLKHKKVDQVADRNAL